MLVKVVINLMYFGRKYQYVKMADSESRFCLAKVKGFLLQELRDAANAEEFRLTCEKFKWLLSSEMVLF